MPQAPEPKKAPVKVNEDGTYIDIFPETFADIVYSNNERKGHVRDELDKLREDLGTVETTADAAAILVVSSTAPAAPKTNMIWVKP